MKADIHPTYHETITVTCACGNEFTVGSTSAEISVEICSNCHPFYTGKSKLVDTAGRVDKFAQRLAQSAAKQKAQAEAKKTTHSKKKTPARKKTSKTVKLS